MIVMRCRVLSIANNSHLIERGNIAGWARVLAGLVSRAVVEMLTLGHLKCTRIRASYI